MKISKTVREKYQILCPKSTNKCDSFSEIDYKIRRSVDIGEKIVFRDESVIGYHNLVFYLKDNVINDMQRLDSGEGYIHISEKKKRKHERIHNKLIV